MQRGRTRHCRSRMNREGKWTSCRASRGRESREEKVKGRGQRASAGKKLTSDQRRRGFQACAVRQGPCQSCSSSVVGQRERQTSSEHWRSCSRRRQWTWRNGVLRGTGRGFGIVGGGAVSAGGESNRTRAVVRAGEQREAVNGDCGALVGSSRL